MKIQRFVNPQINGKGALVDEQGNVIISVYYSYEPEPIQVKPVGLIQKHDEPKSNRVSGRFVVRGRLEDTTNDVFLKTKKGVLIRLVEVNEQEKANNDWCPYDFVGEITKAA